MEVYGTKFGLSLGVSGMDNQTALAVQSLLDSQTISEAPPGRYHFMLLSFQMLVVLYLCSKII